MGGSGGESAGGGIFVGSGLLALRHSVVGGNTALNTLGGGAGAGGAGFVGGAGGTPGAGQAGMGNDIFPTSPASAGRASAGGSGGGLDTVLSAGTRLAGAWVGLADSPRSVSARSLIDVVFADQNTPQY
jgi:hypothetical protein